MDIWIVLKAKMGIENLIDFSWMNEYMEEFVYKKFLPRVCMGLYFKRKHLTSWIQNIGGRGGGSSRNHPPIWQTVVPCQLPPQASNPDFTWLQYWHIAPSALPHSKLKDAEPQEWIAFYPRGTTDSFLQEEWPLPLNSYGVAIQHCQSHEKELLSHSPPTQGHYRNWTGNRNHCGYSYIFQAQWTHIYTEKAKSESHFRTVKRPVLDPLSSDFLF